MVCILRKELETVSNMTLICQKVVSNMLVANIYRRLVPLGNYRRVEAVCNYRGAKAFGNYQGVKTQFLDKDRDK